MGSCSLSYVSEGTGRVYKHHTVAQNENWNHNYPTVSYVSLNSPPVTDTGNTSTAVIGWNDRKRPPLSTKLAISCEVCTSGLHKKQVIWPATRVRIRTGVNINLWLFFKYYFFFTFQSASQFGCFLAFRCPKSISSVTLLTAIVQSAPQFPKSASQQSPLLCPCSLGRCSW